MVQWFKNLKIFILRFLGVKPVSLSLNLEETEKVIQKSALVINAYAKDEAIRAVHDLLRAQQTRSLFALASFSGSLETLHKLQGHLQAIEGLLKFIDEAEKLKAEDIRAIRGRTEKSDSKARVLRMGPSSRRQDVVI